jgi:hypothetical protein
LLSCRSWCARIEGCVAFAGAVTNYRPKTSNTSTSDPREMITHTNSIVISVCPSACASRFRLDSASKSVGMISRLLG